MIGLATSEERSSGMGADQSCRSDHQRDSGSCGRVTWACLRKGLFYGVCEGGVSEVVLCRAFIFFGERVEVLLFFI